MAPHQLHLQPPRGRPAVDFSNPPYLHGVQLLGRVSVTLVNLGLLDNLLHLWNLLVGLGPLVFLERFVVGRMQIFVPIELT